MKFGAIIIYLFAAFVFASCAYDLESKQNLTDIYKIRPGMKASEVSSIMRNKPVKTHIANNADGDTTLIEFYGNNAFGASENFRIYYNPNDSTVIEINYGE